jgi:deoxyribodipyrimidine photo-lyase (single-stranded DNA-specific)
VSLTLYWITQDLRLDDNPALLKAVEDSTELVCVYCLDNQWRQPDRYQSLPMGRHRRAFLQQSLLQLDHALALKGQRLLLLEGDPVEKLLWLVRELKPERLVVSEQVGLYEQRQINRVRAALTEIEILLVCSHTLFNPKQLPFTLAQLPDQFTPFRHQLEAGPDPTSAVSAPAALPPPPHGLPGGMLLMPSMELRDTAFRGGCTEAMAHLEHYFSRSHASIYKQTRNALQGWSNSTRFSPWLANGCLSPRRILSRLKAYEQAQGSNESTYWISFELLWREYFQWYALKHRARLFARSGSGIATRTPLTSFYPERFKQWCQGTTPWPLVNACMRELNATGFISNRGRQIAASCLVNELNIDWRYGAAWFQQQLIDHDVASNWGNWQYIAGVGADPRGGRHFNLVRQAEQFDPDGEYVSRWAPETASSALDSRDAADWPVWVRHD